MVVECLPLTDDSVTTTDPPAFCSNAVRLFESVHLGPMPKRSSVGSEGDKGPKVAKRASPWASKILEDIQ